MTDPAPDAAGTGHQIPLAVGLHAGYCFASFVPGPNGLVVQALRTLAGAGTGGCFLWGPAATGKTHLLQAACAERGADAIYLSLARIAGSGPQVLAGLEGIGLVCLDEVEAVLGDARWDLALFDLFNRIESSGGALAVAARQGPGAFTATLPDLRSRLAAGLVLQLRPVGDAERREALVRRAHLLGFPLRDEVCDFLLTRCSRDMHDLFDVLERLDHHTLAAKRPPTIPLLKEILEAPR